MKFKISPSEAKQQLLEENEFPFIVVMKHGSMSMEYFAPDKVDIQSPHKQDEIYVIIKGDGFFFRDGERVSCKKEISYLFPQVWNTGLKTLVMTLQPGLFFMALMVEKMNNLVCKQPDKFLHSFGSWFFNSSKVGEIGCYRYLLVNDIFRCKS